MRTAHRYGLLQAVRRLACGALLGAAVVLPYSAAAFAQETERGSTGEPGSELVVYLMTIGPGDLIWESFGHNAIWIRDQLRGTDIAYNYGMFSFDQPGFIPRLMRGSMLYWMEGFDGGGSARYYANANRTVVLQELNLTPAQRNWLREFLEWNALPENRFYEYDYYRDNCSTRVRDAIDRALNGQLRTALEGTPTGSSYGSHTQRLTAHARLAYTGLMLAMGQRVEAPIDAWAEGFIPMELSEHVRQVNITGADGSEAPLVLSETVLHQATRPPPPDEPPERLPFYIGIGLVIAIVLLVLGMFAPRGGIPAIAFAALGSVWTAAVGFFGLTIAALWAFTGHEATYSNENLFQVNPVPLVLAVLIPFMAAGARRFARPATAFALLAAVLSVAGLVLQLLPGFSQSNGEIIALVLPAHLAIAWVLSRWPGPGTSLKVDGSDKLWRERAARMEGRYR